MDNEIIYRIKKDYFLRNYHNDIIKNDNEHNIIRGESYTSRYNTRIAKIFKDKNYYVVSTVDYFSGHSLIDRKYEITKYDFRGHYVGEIKNFTKNFFNKLIFIE